MQEFKILLDVLKPLQIKHKKRSLLKAAVSPQGIKYLFSFTYITPTFKTKL